MIEEEKSRIEKTINGGYVYGYVYVFVYSYVYD